MRFCAEFTAERTHDSVAVSVSNVSIGGDGGSRILRDVSLTLEHGERVLIVGPMCRKIDVNAN